MQRSNLVSRTAAVARQVSNTSAAGAILGGARGKRVALLAAGEAARGLSYMEPTLVLSAADAGDGTATVTIAAHRRVYPVQGTIKVPDVAIAAGSLTGAPLGNAGLAIFYVDPTLADPTPTFQFSDNPADAQVGIMPGMHLVGIVPTPVAGASATTGTAGSAPPGYDDAIDDRSTV